MKKIISMILVLVCAFALFSCSDDGDTDTTQVAIDEINEMYSAIAPKLVEINTTTSFGGYVLKGKSTLKTGTVDGFAAVVYEATQEQLRSIEDGADNEIVGPIETVTTAWQYHDDLGYRELNKKGDWTEWDFGVEDPTPPAGAIAMNITSETVKDFVSDADKKTVSFVVEAANTLAVFGVEYEADVQVTISHSGADITGVSIAYTVVNDSNDDHPQIAVAMEISYVYETQVITID